MSTVTQIATAAVRVTKPSKHNAQDRLVLMAERYDIPADEVSHLYAYFMPPIPSKPKTVEQWVGLAVAKRDVRFYLNFYYSDGERLIGCDGSRVHVAPTKLAKGFYDRALQPIDEQGKYPDIDRLFHEGDMFPLNRAELIVSPSKSESKHVYEIPNVGHFDKRYLDELCSLLKDEPIIATHQKGSGSIQFDFGEGRRAVLMGVKLND